MARPSALGEHLGGSRWQWNGEDDPALVLGTDGRASQAAWSERGLVTRWAPIDRRTVLLTIESGRSADRYAVLLFSEDLESYTGYDFHRAQGLARSTRSRASEGELGAPMPRASR